jgi:hypothetical protein
MTIRAFLNFIQERRDWADTHRIPYKEVIAAFVAPNSGFCGPSIRPKYLGDNDDGEGRYGLTRRHVEEILTAFDVTLPPATEF